MESFNLSVETVFPLLNGDCWRLATTLNARTGWGYAGMYADNVMQHVGVAMPDGRIIDAEGLWSPEEWENHWIEELYDAQDVFLGTPTEEDPEYYFELNDHDPASEDVLYGGIALREIADGILSSLKLPQSV